MPVTWSDEKLILLYCPGRGSNSRPSARRSFKHGQGAPRPYPLGHGGSSKSIIYSPVVSIIPFSFIYVEILPNYNNVSTGRRGGRKTRMQKRFWIRSAYTMMVWNTQDLLRKSTKGLRLKLHLPRPEQRGYVLTVLVIKKLSSTTYCLTLGIHYQLLIHQGAIQVLLNAFFPRNWTPTHSLVTLITLNLTPS